MTTPQRKFLSFENLFKETDEHKMCKNAITTICNRDTQVNSNVFCTILLKTLPKAQQTRGLDSSYQSNFFKSYLKFLNKSWSNIFRISTKLQLQNLNQTSAFWQNLNLKILTKPNFRILTKIELHNHNQVSAAK